MVPQLEARELGWRRKALWCWAGTHSTAQRSQEPKREALGKWESPVLIDGSGCLKRMGFGVGWSQSVSLEQAIRVRESQKQSPGGRLGSRPPTEMLVHLFLLPLLLLSKSLLTKEVDADAWIPWKWICSFSSFLGVFSHFFLTMAKILCPCLVRYKYWSKSWQAKQLLLLWRRICQHLTEPQVHLLSNPVISLSGIYL